MYSSTELLERWTHADGDKFCAAVGESWNHGREAQNEWGQQKLRRMESWEGGALF